MPKYNKGFINPYQHSLVSNNSEEMFDYTMTNLMDNFYRSAMSTTTDGVFKAVCLSGMNTEDNLAGTGTTDGLVQSQMVNIIVRPLTDFGNIMPDPRLFSDPEKINQVISMHAATFTARSDYDVSGTDAISFAQIVDCYFEKGSIKNSSFNTLRFMKPEGLAQIEVSFSSLGLISGVDVTNWSGAFLLGSGAVPSIDELRARGINVRKPKPVAQTGDEALAARVGIPVAVLRAFRAVESGGKASALRFEPHVYMRKSGGVKPPKGFTKGEGVSYSKTPSETNQAAFEAAYAVNKVWAVESTSFGLYQVLGGKGIKVYKTAELFWEKFQADSLATSNELLVQWFKDRPAAKKAANDLNFTRLAELYNGSEQAKHHYDAMLQDAYQSALKL